MQLIPIAEYNWGDDMSMKSLTCKNHPTARYTTKNPFSRTLHLLEKPFGMTEECPCPFRDLAVIVEESDKPNG